MNNNKKLINNDTTIDSRIALFPPKDEIIKFSIFYDHNLWIDNGQYNFKQDKITGNKLQIGILVESYRKYIRLNKEDRIIVHNLIIDIVRKAYKDYFNLSKEVLSNYVRYDFEVNFPYNFKDTILNLVRKFKMKRFLEGKY